MVIKSEVSPLVSTDKPKADEGVLGYLIRMAEHNGYSRISWILELVDLNIHSRSLLWTESEISRLASLFRLETKELRKLCYTAGKATNASKIVLPSGDEVSRHFIDLKNTAICPECIKEKGSIPWMWDLNVVTHCDKHGVPLADHCDNCEGVAHFNRGTIGFCLPYCSGPNLSAPVSKQVRSLMALIRWKTTTTKSAFPEAGFDSSLKKMCFDQLLNILSILIAGKNGRLDRRGRRLSKLDKDELRHGVEVAANALSDWPFGFYKYLDDLCGTETQKGDEIVLNEQFGSFYKALVQDGADYSLLLNGISRYLKRGMNGAVVTARGCPVALSDTNQRELLPRYEVRKSLGVTSKELTRLIESGYLATRSIKSSYGLGPWICRESLIRYADFRKAALSLSDSATRLGTTTYAIRKLVRAGILDALHSPEKDGCYRWLIYGSSVRNLEKALRRKSIISPPNKQRISFHKAVENYNASGVSYGVLTQAVLKGCVRISIQPDGVGVLSNMSVVLEDIYKLVHGGTQLSLLIPPDPSVKTNKNPIAA